MSGEQEGLLRMPSCVHRVLAVSLVKSHLRNFQGWIRNQRKLSKREKLAS